MVEISPDFIFNDFMQRDVGIPLTFTYNKVPEGAKVVCEGHIDVHRLSQDGNTVICVKHLTKLTGRDCPICGEQKANVKFPMVVSVLNKGFILTRMRLMPKTTKWEMLPTLLATMCKKQYKHPYTPGAFQALPNFPPIICSRLQSWHDEFNEFAYDMIKEKYIHLLGE